MENPSYFSLALRYGLLFGALMFFVDIGLWYTGLSTLQNANGWTNWVLAGLGVYLAADTFKKGNEGFARFTEIMKTGAWMGLIGGGLFGIAKTIQLYLDPSISKQIFALMEEQFEKQSEVQNIPEETYDQMIRFFKIFTSPVSMGLLTWFSIFITFFLVGLLVGLILKKDRDVFDPKSLDV